MNEAFGSKTKHLITRAQWAEHLHKAGFTVMPIKPGTKRTYQPWSMWEKQNEEMVLKHWQENPDDDIAVHTVDMYVLDCDHPASQAALTMLKAKHGMRPSVIVRTLKGAHEWYALPEGVTARQVGHDTNDFPDRIDVRTGSAYIIAPGSTDKSVVTWEIETRHDLMPVTQAFVDEIGRHNGEALKPSAVSTTYNLSPLGDVGIPHLREVLSFISPDIGHSDWVRVGMALYWETQGSDAGRDLFDEWSKAGHKYEGLSEILSKWRSFNKEVESPVTRRTLYYMAREAGATLQGPSHESDAWFERVKAMGLDMDAAPQESAGTPQALVTGGGSLEVPFVVPQEHPLMKFSVTGILDELVRRAMNRKKILGGLVVTGELTAIYAQYNVGKTLLALHLISKSIKAGEVDPSKVFYLNMDDNVGGLAHKAKIAADLNFQMISGGLQGFNARAFYDAVRLMVEQGSAQDSIIFLDTLTRFTDTQSKGEGRDFAGLMREFAVVGGTVVVLGHVNKNEDASGSKRHEGTSDVPNGFDVAYNLVVLAEEKSHGRRTVAFTNFKNRGEVIEGATYSYLYGSSVPYQDKLDSIELVDDQSATSLHRQSTMKPDDAAVQAIKSCLAEGINKKMSLLEEAANRSEMSEGKVEKVLDKYTGKTPGEHLWFFSTRNPRGAKLYQLLDANAPDSQVPSSPAPKPAQGQGQGQPDSFMPYPDESDPQYVDADSSELEDVRF